MLQLNANLKKNFVRHKINLPLQKKAITHLKLPSFIIGAVILSLVVCLSVIYIPYLQEEVFKTVALNIPELLIIIGLSSLGFIYLEISKFFRWKKQYKVTA